MSRSQDFRRTFTTFFFSKLKIALSCVLLLGLAMLFIPQGAVLPPGLTLAQQSNYGTGSAPAGVTGGNPVSLTGATIAGGANTTQLAVPSTPVVTCNGACAGGTWSYAVAALDINSTASTGAGAFPTKASANGSATNAVTLTTTNKNIITWTAIPNAASYNVYRTVSAGAPANLSLVCAATTLLTCTDDGSVNTAGTTVPTINMTGSLKFPACSFSPSADLTTYSNFTLPGGGITTGQNTTGICFDAGGNTWWFNPTHAPPIYLGQAFTLKWSEHECWSPNGTYQNVALGVCIGGDIGRGFDTAPFMFDVGGNDVTDDSTAYIATAGYSKVFTATLALTAGQVVKIDTANDNSVLVAAMTDTAAGIPVGIVLNSPGAAGIAYVLVAGSTALPVLGTGTCTRGQFVIVDTTTAGRVKCSTYTAGTVIGYATTAQAAVGSAVTVLVQLK